MPIRIIRVVTGMVLSVLVIAWASSILIYLIKYWYSIEAAFPAKTIALVFFSLALAVGAVALFSSRQRLGLLVALTMGLATLYLVEIIHYTQTYYPGFPSLSPPLTIERALVDDAEASGIWLDKRTKVEVIRDLRLRGIPAYPAFLVTNRSPWDSNPNLFQEEPLPLGSISNSTVVHCNESGKWSIYDSDEKGFNNSPGLWSDSKTTALLLGDSFVHGACVDPGEDFGGQIRLKYPKTINLGQRGNGPLLQLAGIREYGASLKPDYVFWFYTENNDLDNLRKEIDSSFLRRYLDPKFQQGLMNRTAGVDEFIETFTEYNYKLAQKTANPSLVTHLKFILFLRSLRKRVGLEVSPASHSSNEWKLLQGIRLFQTGGPSNIDPPKSEKSIGVSKDELMYSMWFEQLPNFNKVLRSADDAVRSWGGQLVFVFLPEGNRFVDPSNKVYTLRTEVLSIVEALGVPIIDATDVIGDGDHERFFPIGGGHYNPRGYAVIAKQVTDFMDRP